MNTERDIFIENNNGTKNGAYTRTLNTKYAFIDDLKVPRDREGNFRTMVFEPYRRSLDIEDLILALYSNGISTRRISMILEEIFQGRYSKSTISKITDVVKLCIPTHLMLIFLHPEKTHIEMAFLILK